MATPSDVAVAVWMKQQVDHTHWLDQEHAASLIFGQFGEQHIYYNENGNLAISRSVLRAFRKLTEQTVVWVRPQKAWRSRTPYDPPGKREVDY